MEPSRERLEELRALKLSNNQRARLEELRKIKDDQFSQSETLQPNVPTIAQQFASDTAGKLEAGLSVGSGLVAPIIAGATATPFAASDSMAAGESVRQDVQESLTYQPRTQSGQSFINIGRKMMEKAVEFEPLQFANEKLIQPVSKEWAVLGDYINETYGPAAATVVTTTPTAIGEFLGLGVLSRMRTGTRLLDDNGVPTKALENALEKEGLIFENLTPEAKEIIPEFATPKMLPSPKSEVGKQSEDVLIKQIESNGRGDALAPLMLENGKIVADKLGVEAARQGYHPGTIQMVKTANAATRKSMGKMLNMMRRIKKDDTLMGKLRPYDVVGDAFSKRLNLIRDKAIKARDRLEVIARNKLPGLNVDATPVLNQLGDSLENLNIKEVTTNSKGQKRPNYEGSDISQDKTSQKIINSLLDLLGEGGAPDAERLHRLKRQFDRMIDFRKKSKGGLTDAGRDVLKEVRFSVNQVLRGTVPEYAEVNDVLHKSLTAFDNFKDATKIKIDIFGENGSAAIGQESRKLLTNYKSRNELRESFDQIESLANEFGGNFTESYSDLAIFANRLDEKFGSAAPGSMLGIMQSTVNQAVTDPKSAVVQTVIGKSFQVAEELRGINDFNAFRSMSELLKRK